jgi:hypothetical protein
MKIAKMRLFINEYSDNRIIIAKYLRVSDKLKRKIYLCGKQGN